MNVKPPFMKFRFRLDLPTGRDQLRKVYPFQRAWVAIIIVAAVDAVFAYPAITGIQEAAAEWDDINSLFDLVFSALGSFWLLGWSIAPIILTLVLVVTLFGREVVVANKDSFSICLGLPIIMFEMQYEAKRMRNLRHTLPDKKAGTSWRGPHLVFDYGSQEIAFGSAIAGAQVSELRNQIMMATGQNIRSGDALPETLAEEERLKKKRWRNARPKKYQPLLYPLYVVNLSQCSRHPRWHSSSPTWYPFSAHYFLAGASPMSW